MTEAVGLLIVVVALLMWRIARLERIVDKLVQR